MPFLYYYDPRYPTDYKFINKTTNSKNKNKGKTKNKNKDKWSKYPSSDGVLWFLACAIRSQWLITHALYEGNSINMAYGKCFQLSTLNIRMFTYPQPNL